MKCQFAALGIVWAGLFAFGCAPDLKVTGAGGAGGSGGAISTSEDCTDGIDNDGDSLVDCADTTDCQKLFTCNPLPPPGWTYVLIRRPPYGAAPSPCPDDTEPQILYEEPTKADCTPCNCQVAGNCTNSLNCFLSTDCSGPSATQMYSTDQGCMSLTNPTTLGSCSVDPIGAVPVNVACSFSGGMVMNTKPFNKEAHVCLATVNQSGCGESTCLAKPSPPLENKLCLMQPGNSPCPVDFSELHSVYGGYMDSRDCSACTCDQSQVKCAGLANLVLWDDGFCTKNPQPIDSNDGCVPLVTNPKDISITNLQSLSIPKSGCLGGAPSGEVTGTDPMTICCQKI